MLIAPPLVIYSCTEVENTPDDATLKNGIELRLGEEVETTIFDVGSCGGFYDLEQITKKCKDEEGRYPFTYTGIEPFPDCEFFGEVSYIECDFDGDLFYDVYINEPKFTTNCPEFAEFISANDLRWGDAIEIALQGIMSRIEYDLWFNELEYVQNMDVCHNSPHHEISWIKATCTSTRALIDLNNNITIVKEYCQGSGCCSRNTYYCYSKESGVIEKIVSIVEVDQPANECDNSEVVNEEYSGTPYGTSIPCSHNCDEIED